MAIILICSVLFQKGVNNMYNPLKDITEEDKHIGAENREMRRKNNARPNDAHSVDRITSHRMGCRGYDCGC